MTETVRQTTHARTYLMCPPEHFVVEYAINPWMDPDKPVDVALAMQQWERVGEAFTSLGHTVRTIRPEPSDGLAANGATVIGGILSAQFGHPERRPEAAAYLNGSASRVTAIRESAILNRGGATSSRGPCHPGWPRLARKWSDELTDLFVSRDQPATDRGLPPRHRAGRGDPQTRRTTQPRS